MIMLPVVCPLYGLPYLSASHMILLYYLKLPVISSLFFFPSVLNCVIIILKCVTKEALHMRLELRIKRRNTMNNIKLFSDSSCDLPKEFLEQYDITLIPFYVSFDQEHYYKEIEEMPIDQFYHRLSADKIFPKTSLPSVQDYIDNFKSAIELGKEVVCLCLTSVFSGSCQSARTARDILMDEFPDARIEIIDSIQATAGQGITMAQIAYMAADGYSVDQILARTKEILPTSRIMFTVGTLEYLQKGGRIGKVASLAGSILNLKPMIQLYNGELNPAGTVRGRNKSIDRVITMVKEYFDQTGERYEDYDFCLAYGTYLDDIKKIKGMTEELIGRTIDFPFCRIGVTIGTNTGPDALGVCFIRRYNAK